ncbi:MAG: peroxidase [Candidatus Methylomirabilota bacterium]|nr:carboxymuconolactone decarboxylase family protein [Candidatus Methylomirabilis sp.]NJD67321.1 peroxidase [candidate division NC10 bacterium]PWB47869.1 MAG: peroxidase [candidate division NC10 bacterium]
MTWINVIEEREAQGNLKSLYEGLRKQTGMVPNIMKVFSLHPEAMGATLQMFQVLMYGPAALGRAQREMIALVVSSINRCHY